MSGIARKQQSDNTFPKINRKRTKTNAMTHRKCKTAEIKNGNHTQKRPRTSHLDIKKKLKNVKK